MRRTKRDIYKSKNDRTFNPESDIDLADLRLILDTRERSEEQNEWLGHYINNIAKIVIKSSKFCGYPDFVKNEIVSLGCIDAVNGCNGFDGERYTAATAPFSYIYRIIRNRGFHVTKAYYKDKAVPFSSLPELFERNVSDTTEKGLEIYNHHEEIKERSLNEFFVSSKEIVAPTDIIRNRVKRSLRCVLQRKLQMQLNLA